MARASDAILLVSVLALLVIVLGVAESGVGPSASPPVGSPGTHRTTQTGTTVSSGQTTAKSTTAHRTTKTASPPTQGSATSATTGSSSVAPWLSLQVAAWYILIPAVVCLAGGMIALLIRKEKPKIFDLKAVVKEMESQRDYFTSSLSKRLRNAALLRYYVLMAEVCARLGILDRPTDTPHEFIGRASVELNVEAADAERFAEVVDRAHYGAELSVEEVASATRFMDSFTRVIVGRAAIG
ncbi:MAG TPA: DUF4129 domain-containing protein [Nitrososphaerales archaeon]|nr:DUF4129 domain-containing protein [Nitrososphaerales archaeon]